MYLRFCLIAALAASTAISAITPAERVSADTSLYIEGAPLAEGISAIRNLVGNVAGEGVWSMLSAQFEQKAGVNLLEPAKLEELGVDTKNAWALALNVEFSAEPNSFKPDFVMIIPVQNNTKFYEFLKAKMVESQMQTMKEIAPGREMHFGTEADPGFMIRSENALMVSNKLEMIKPMAARASQPVQNAVFYASMKPHLWSKNQNKAPLAAFYLNPKLIIQSLKAQTEMIKHFQAELNRGDENTPAPTLDENSPFIAEIRDNLQSSAGAFVANADRVSLYYSYKYKEGYLADTSKIYPRILLVNAGPLSSDSLSRNPLVHSMLKLNIPALIEFMKTLSPLFADKYQKAMAEAKQELQVDIEKSIIANLKGNYNFSLLNIPPDSKMKDMTAYEIFGAFGIKAGSGKEWLKLLKSGQKLAEKTETRRNKKNKSKWTFEEIDEGQLVTISFKEGGKPASVTFLIRENDVIVSNTKLNAIKGTKGSDKTLTERLMNLSYNTTQGIFFLDLQQVYKALLKSKEGNSIKAYAQMMEKLKSLSAVSSIQGDFATGETTLQLKK